MTDHPHPDTCPLMVGTRWCITPEHWRSGIRHELPDRGSRLLDLADLDPHERAIILRQVEEAQQ